MRVKPHLKYNDTQARCSSCKQWKDHDCFYQRHIGDTGPPVWPRCKKCRGVEEGKYRPSKKDAQKPSPGLCANGTDCVWFEQLEQPAPLRKTGRVHNVCESCNSRRIEGDVAKAQEKAEKAKRAQRY
jgi:hypothetical protein